MGSGWANPRAPGLRGHLQGAPSLKHSSWYYSFIKVPLSNTFPQFGCEILITMHSGADPGFFKREAPKLRTDRTLAPVGHIPLRSREKLQVNSHNLVHSFCLGHQHKDRHPISAKNRGTWNYGYLACKIQNFLRQGGAAPLQPHTYTFWQRRDWNCAFMVPSKYTFSYEKKSCPLQPLDIIHFCKLRPKRAWNYAYLACKIQTNFLRQAWDSTPLQPPKSYIHIKKDCPVATTRNHIFLY